MKIKKILELVAGELLSKQEHIDYQVEFGIASDLISDILMCVESPAVLFTGLINHQIIRVAEMVDLQAIVFVRGKKPTEEILELAKDHDLPILSTRMSLYQACALAHQGGLKPLKIKVSM